ncbi:hypothetical protein [Bacillus sp. AFS017274]|uniref:hypothetical protein n=1 Tax=Bacillaceae TaxID=186817 RepID=UPI000BF46F27|nr:hypothetical protein [Bacillus sp. AFS017274]PEZ68546.1 hypothetical protein CN380_27560 [Bacillus sp. AFS017274]
MGYMIRSKYLKVIIPLALIVICVYWYYSSIVISGTSENGMWKVTYSKNIDSSEPTGWEGHLNQRNNDNVTVKAIVVEENDKINTSIDSFEEGRAEDGEITVLHPFSDDFYLGPKPSKGTVVSVVWEHDDKTHTDIIKIR